MSAQLIIREPLGERLLADRALPVSIGGAGSDIVLPASASGPLAWIGVQDGQLFLQPASAEAVVLHNGARISGSTWLRTGDVLDVGGGRLRLRADGETRLLEVIAGAADNATAPPQVADTASVAGAGGEDQPIEAVAFRRAGQVVAARTSPPWRRIGIYRRARAARWSGGLPVHIGTDSARHRSGSRTAVLRGRFAGARYRHEPPDAAG